MANTYTPVYALAKPARNDIDWDDELNGNFDLIDAALHGIQTALDTHEANTLNPHAVTAIQVGAVTAGHTHPGSEVVSQVAAASNADKVDSRHFDMDTATLSLSYSTSGITFKALLEKALWEATYDITADGRVGAADSATISTTAGSAAVSTNAAHADSATISTTAQSATISTTAQSATVSGDADTVDLKQATDLVWKVNTAGTSIQVAVGSTLDFKVGTAITSYVNSYGLVGSVYNSDLAEGFITNEKELPLEGTVMVLIHDNSVRKSESFGSDCFAGIVSYHPGMLLGMSSDWQWEFEVNRKIPLAIVGQVHAKVCAYDFNVYPGCGLIVDRDGCLAPWKGVGFKVAQAMDSIPGGTEKVIKVLVR